MSQKTTIAGDYRQPGEPATATPTRAQNRETIRLEIQRNREERVRNLNRLADWHRKRYLIAAQQPENRDRFLLWTR